MIKMRRLAVLAAAAASVVVLGCGETVIDDVKTEDAIQHNLEKEVGRQIEAVDCPTDVEVETGGQFDCEITLPDGSSETAQLRILNEDADVELVRLSPAGGGDGGGGGAEGEGAGADGENGADQ